MSQSEISVITEAEKFFVAQHMADRPRVDLDRDRPLLPYILRWDNVFTVQHFTTSFSSREVIMTQPDTLRQCWSAVLDLDIDEVSDCSNFFDLGGDSVQAIRLVEIAREHRLRLDVETVFNCPDFQDMLTSSDSSSAIEVSKLPSHKRLDFVTLQTCADACGVKPDSVEDIFPTIGMQDDMMQGHLYSGAWLMQMVFELQGTQNIEYVCKAFETIRARNQVFRTRLVQMDSGVLQVALKDPIVWQHATDLKRYLAKDSKLRMGYGQPLVRHAVIQESAKTYIVWTCLHCVMDGWTRRLLWQDLESYLANPVAFTAKPHRPSFKDFVSYRRSLDSEEADKFFKHYLADLPNMKSLYTIPKGHTALTNRSITTELFVDRPTRGIVTFSTMGLAALALAVGQVTESYEITLETLRGARTEPMPGIESVMGPLLSGMLLKVQLPPEKPVSAFLRQLQDTATQMMKYEPFSLKHYPAFGTNQITFNWHPLGSDLLSKTARFSVGEDEASFCAVQRLYPNPQASLGYVFNVYDQDDHVIVSSEFDDHLLEASLIERVQDLFAAKLKKICAGQQMSVRSLMT